MQNLKSKLTPLQIIAIEQAAAGLISGPLNEWPILVSAIKSLALPYSVVRTSTVNLCKLIISHSEWKYE